MAGIYEQAAIYARRHQLRHVKESALWKYYGAKAEKYDELAQAEKAKPVRIREAKNERPA